MSTVNVEQVRDSLKKCMDPEVPLSIVDMGLIYGIDITENNDVNIKMTMTTKGCPLHETMVDDVKRYTKKVSGVNNVDVEIVWDPPWTMDKMSDTAKAMMKTMGSQSTPAPINYETAVPQGVGKLVKQEDGSLVLANEHEQGFMVNQAIIDFWKSCNGQRKVTELVDLFAQQISLISIIFAKTESIFTIARFSSQPNATYQSPASSSYFVSSVLIFSDSVL